MPKTERDFERHYGLEFYLGKIVEGPLNTHYVITAVGTFREYPCFEATQLGNYTESRPNPVYLPLNTDKIIHSYKHKQAVLATHGTEYRKILKEINKKGGKVGIPPVKKSPFDLG